MNQPTDKVKLVFQFWMLLFVVGLFYSQFLLSVSTGLMVCTAIFSCFKDRALQKFNWQEYFHTYAYSGLSLIFIAVFISGLWSSDLTEWLHHCKMKLIFLFLPWSYYVIHKNTGINFEKFLFLFIAICTISTFPVLIHYLLNFGELTKALGQGQPIPTPINHIIYSLYLAYTILVLSSYWIQQESKKSSKHILIGVGIIYLILVIHILAVRSGLAIFYASSILLIFIYILKSKKYLTGFIITTILLISPIVAYKTIPSIHKRAGYMMYDINMYLSGNATNYSDSGRLYSLKVGFTLWKENALLGTGIGDLKRRCAEKYKLLYNWENERTLYPHNQYLFILAGTGLLGFILFVLGLGIPLAAYSNYKDINILILYLVFLMSFLVNNSFERSVGFSFFIFILLILMKPRKE